MRADALLAERSFFGTGDSTLVRSATWSATGGNTPVQHGWDHYDLWCKFHGLGCFGGQVLDDGLQLQLY